MLKFTFMPFKPWLNNFSCVNGAIIILEAASLFRNNIWIRGCTWLTNLSTYVLPYIISTMKGNSGTNKILYHNIVAQTIIEPHPYFNVGAKNFEL
jgi:hypothetical protein